MRTRLLVTLVLLGTLLISGCGIKPDSTTPERVKIAMGFVPNVQFAPMYVALERGYFAEEGLDIELDYGMETDLLQRVGADQIKFAIASGDQVILARSNDLPVRYVFNWYRRFPVCVVSLSQQQISGPQDLIGQTVGIPVLEGASYIGWLAFLDQAGIAAEQIDLQVVGYTQVASLTENRVDAAICYAMNEPVQLAEAGYSVRSFYLDEYTHLISNGIITNERTIKKEPALVEAVTRAFARGLQDTLDDPDAAFAIARQAIPEMDDTSAALQRAVLLECLDFWQAEPLGASIASDWQESVDAMLKLGLIQEPLAPADAYTNRFVE